jgi:hypothetical protein
MMTRTGTQTLAIICSGAIKAVSINVPRQPMKLEITLSAVHRALGFPLMVAGLSYEQMARYQERALKLRIRSLELLKLFQHVCSICTS